MLFFNPARMFVLRGINKPHKFLVDQGFASTTASDLLNSAKPTLRTSYLERLCLLLGCTPNDLYEWKPDNKSAVDENHPLKSLQKEEITPMHELIKDIPVEKLAEVQEILRNMKNQE